MQATLDLLPFAEYFLAIWLTTSIPALFCYTTVIQKDVSILRSLPFRIKLTQASVFQKRLLDTFTEAGNVQDNIKGWPAAVNQ